MNRDWRVWCVAWGAWCLTIAAAVIALAIGLVTETERTVLVGHMIGVVAMGGLGAYVVTRRPGTLTGWLLMAFALSAAFGSSGWMIGWFQVVEGGIDFSVLMPLLATSFAVWSVPYAALLLLALTAPDGALISPRWRFAVAGVAIMAALWITASIAGLLSADEADLPILLSNTGLADDPGVLSQGAVVLWNVTLLTMGIVLLASLAAMTIRYRQSRGEERQRLKWVASGLSLTLLLHVGEVTEASTEPWMTLQDLIPLAAYLSLTIGFGFALLRYRLWDIDVVIQRSLIYGTLWLAIAGLYFGVALALGLAASSQVPVWSAVGLTVLATLLFQPARRGLERAADHWVFGRREEPLKVVHGFGATLGNADRADEIAALLAHAVTAAAPLGWLKVTVPGSREVEVGSRREGPTEDLQLSYGGECLGRASYQVLSGSRLSAQEQATLQALTDQAAVAISRAQLASRIVRAQEAERRRLERNIHDGAQQELVALVAKLGLARSQNGSLDHARFLTELQAEVRTILANLRELAQGVHPSVLTDGGLAAAVEDRCSRLTMPVLLEVDDELRGRHLGDDIEAAAYYAVSEGLTNLLRHSNASSAFVALRVRDDRLSIEVADDGTGFEPRGMRNGGGLQGLSDRLRALGGELEVESAPGKGTRLTCSLPVATVASV